MNDDIKHYRLVFTGNLLSGYNQNKVVTGLQDLLNLNREQAELLVSGKHNQINKELTLERAEKLRLLILQQGAECVLLPIENSFITTQQLPKFVNDDEDKLAVNGPLDEKQIDVNGSKGISRGIEQESIRNNEQASVSSWQNARLKTVFIILLLMIAEAVVIWNIRPGAQAPGAGNSATHSSVAKTGKAPDQSHQTRQLSVTESDTDSKLKSLSIRASTWFSEQDAVIKPADVNWIWIQGDRGISVREMNDSWGNAIRYYGNSDGFELRSSGTDGIFYTKDDIFRITTL